MTSPTSRFVELVVQHQQDVLRFLRALGLREGDVDEVLQQTMMRIWEKWEEYDPHREFLPWALKFAHLETLKFREHRGVERLIFNSETVMALATHARSEPAVFDSRLDSLRFCLKRLRTRDYDLLIRKYGMGQPAAELAGQLRSTTKAVYRRLDRIREQLASCMRRQIAETEG